MRKERLPAKNRSLLLQPLGQRAANENFQFTVPEDSDWILVLCSLSLVCDANPASRQVNITATKQGHGNHIIGASRTAIEANADLLVQFSSGVVDNFMSAISDKMVIPIACQIIPAGYTVLFSVNNAQAGDLITNLNFRLLRMRQS